jgi:hypothetical protein
VAQFVYLLLNNEKIREVIDTLTTKAVLILGRFTPERKPLLEGLRQSLRTRNYLPVVPVQPILLESQHEPGMFDFFKKYPWVLRTAAYTNINDLLASVDERIIAPAEARASELRNGYR